jgi:thiamine biosynthesis lipoprotein
MGTYYRVTVVSLPEAVTEGELREKVEECLRGIEGRMSTYDPASEISQFNRSADTGWFPVSDQTATVVAAALEIFVESEGAFDVTVGPLVDLWGFGPSGKVERVPDAESIERARAETGAGELEVRLSPPAIKKARVELRIDLSAIAKGYAVDSVAAVLDALGAVGYLVDIGGEMSAAGEKAAGVPWRVAIESPIANQQGIQRRMVLADGAIATSGDYRNFFERDGERYSHEIDPRTGRPIRHGLALVSVLAPSCMRADAWATALIVLGEARGRELAERVGLAAFFVVREGSEFAESQTSKFEQILSNP